MSKLWKLDSNKIIEVNEFLLNSDRVLKRFMTYRLLN